MSIFDDIMRRAEAGERVSVSLASRSVRAGGQTVIDNGKWMGELGLAAAAPEDALAHIEELYDVYSRSLPSQLENSRSRVRRWFHAGDCDDDDMLWGEDQLAARCRLELTVLCYMLNGSLTRTSAPFAGKWFWQSSRYPGLSILTEWLPETRSPKKKYMIEYLDIDENYYIENDDIKFHQHEGQEEQEGTWEEMRSDVLKILLAMKKYDEEHNGHNDQIQTQ